MNEAKNFIFMFYYLKFPNTKTEDKYDKRTKLYIPIRKGVI